MDKAEKEKIKEERKANKLALREKNKKLAAYPRMHPIASALARPVVSGVSGYASGALDAALGTETNQHWPSFVNAGVSIVGGAIATVAGHPTVGHGLADWSTGPVAWLSGAAGFEMVKRRKQRAAAAPAG